MTKSRPFFGPVRQFTVFLNNEAWTHCERELGQPIPHDVWEELSEIASRYLSWLDAYQALLTDLEAAKSFEIGKKSTNSLRGVLSSLETGPFLTSALAPHYRASNGAAISELIQRLDELAAAFENAEITKQRLLGSGRKPNDPWNRMVVEVLECLKRHGLPSKHWTTDTNCAPAISFLQAFEANLPSGRRPLAINSSWVDRIDAALADWGRN